MKRLITGLLAFLPCTVFAQSYSWSFPIGTNYSDTVTAVDVNPLGEILIAGKMDGWQSINVNPTGIPYLIQPDENHFLGIYKPDGTVKWALSPFFDVERAGTANAFTAWQAGKFAPNGDVVVSGSLDRNAMQFSTLGGIYYEAYKQYCTDVIFCRYNSDGELLWGFNTGSWYECNYPIANSIAIDPADTKMYFGGHVDDKDNIDFDPFGGGYATGTDVNGAFIASYNNDGTYNWSMVFGDYADMITDLETDAAGNVIAVGVFSTFGLDFDPIGGTNFIMSPNGGGYDGFICQYNSNGEIMWGFNIGGGADDFIHDIEIDADGSFYITGKFDYLCEFNPLGASVVLDPIGGHDIFVAKYDTNGELIWVQTYGSPDLYEQGNRVKVSNGKLFVTGYFQETIDFGGGFVLNPGASRAGFVLVLDPTTGNLNDAKHFTGGSAVNVEAAFDNPVSGNLNIIGTFRNTAKLNTASSTITDYSNGQADIFVANYCYVLGLTHDPVPAVCENNAPFSPSGASLSGGVYTGTGIINGEFYPLLTGPGQFPAIYSYSNAYGCSASVPTTITVNANPIVLLDPYASMCAQDEPIHLFGGIPAGGTYSGNGVQNLMFNPSVAGTGPSMVSYSYTNPTTGCSSTANSSITVYPNPSLSVTAVDATCGSNDGAASAFATGGSIPYNYYWSNGAVTPANNNIPAGQYQITVTDGRGCQNFAMANVSDVNGPQITVGTITNTTCPADANGSAAISVSGGVSPYTYTWSNGSTAQNLAGVVAGTYEVTVKDASGCSAVRSITVGGPAQFSANASIQSPSCGSTNGSIALNVSGGTAPFMYQWSTGVTTSSITGAGVGAYEVLVTDVNGCIGEFDFVLSEIGAPTINLVSSIVTPCNSTNGGIQVNVFGNGPFTYNWNDGVSSVGTNQNLSNVGVGTYFLTATDNLGCSSMFIGNVGPEFPITEICLVTVDTATGTNLVVWEKPIVNYIDGYRIYRESSVSGQYQPIAYIDYNDLSQYTDLAANPLVRGWRYKITAVDNCGNESVLSPRHKTIHLTNSYGLGGQINLSWDDYEGFPFSTFAIWRYSDQAGFSLLQNLPSNLRSFTDIAPPAGNVYYFIEVVPDVPCVSTRAVNHNTTRSNKTQTIASPTGVDEFSAVTNMTIYPQPNNGQFNVSLNSRDNGVATMSIYGADGKLVRREQMTLNAGAQVFTFYSDMASGIYQFVIETADQRLTERLVVTN